MEYRSRVYTDRPDYADYDSPEKFQAITGIIMTRLKQHPNAICSYSGGADSDIMIDLIENARKMVPSLPPVKYVFFNTGLEMKATKDHVKATAEKYGVEIVEARPRVNIVMAVRKHGVPFVSKIMSGGLSEWQKKGVPLSIAEEYEQAEDKHAKRQELSNRYPKCESLINFLCCCNRAGDPRPDIQIVINSSKYMRDFIAEYPPDFKISAKCCDYCKKQLAHSVQKGYEIRALRARGSVSFKDIILRAGYSVFAPATMISGYITISTGRPEWGAAEGEEYYVLHITGMEDMLTDEQSRTFGVKGEKKDNG